MGLEKLTQLTELNLRFNPDLTKAQVAELQNLQQPYEVTRSSLPPSPSNSIYTRAGEA